VTAVSATQQAPAATRHERERPGIIDCDVHNALRKPEDLKAYLPAKWHVYYDQGLSPGLSAGQHQASNIEG
jgi:hypothetical protein